MRREVHVDVNFAGRNGKCKTSPVLLGREKICYATRRSVKLLFSFETTVVQTWCSLTAVSQCGHGRHVLISQKLLIGFSGVDLLQTLSGVLEEEVLSSG